MIMLKRRAGKPAPTRRRQNPSTSSSSDTPDSPCSTSQSGNPERSRGATAVAGTVSGALAGSAGGFIGSALREERMVVHMIDHATALRNASALVERPVDVERLAGLGLSRAQDDIIVRPGHQTCYGVTAN